MSNKEKGKFITGFQEDGSIIKRIITRTEGSDGSLGWYPPNAGQKIITKRGPFEVTKSELIEHRRVFYFRAWGKFVEEKEEET